MATSETKKSTSRQAGHILIVRRGDPRKYINARPLPSTRKDFGPENRHIILAAVRLDAGRRGYTGSEYVLREYTPGGSLRRELPIEDAPARSAAAEGTVAGPVAQISEALRHLSPTFVTGDVVLTPGANIGLVVGVNAHEGRASVRTRYGIEHGMPLGSLRTPDLAPAAVWWEALTEPQRKAYLAVSLQVTSTAAWAWAQMVDDAEDMVRRHLTRLSVDARPAPSRTKPLRFARLGDTFIEIGVIGSKPVQLHIRTGIGSTVRKHSDQFLNGQMVPIEDCWVGPGDGLSQCYLFVALGSGWVGLYDSEADELLEQHGPRGLRDGRTAIASPAAVASRS